MNRIVTALFLTATLVSAVGNTYAVERPLQKAGDELGQNEVIGSGMRLDPYGQQFSMGFDGSGGDMSITYDRRTDRVHAIYPGGSLNMPLANLASAYARGDQMRANEFANELRNLTNSGYFYQNDWQRAGFHNGRDGTTPMECAFIPCREINRQYSDGSRETAYDYWDSELAELARGYQVVVDPNKPWWEGKYSAEYIQHDKQMFEVWRNGQCNQARSSGVGAVTSGTGAIATCSVATGGWGALGCATVIGGTMYLGADAAGSAANCSNTSYPGPGRWGND